MIAPGEEGLIGTIGVLETTEDDTFEGFADYAQEVDGAPALRVGVVGFVCFGDRDDSGEFPAGGVNSTP